MILLIVPVFAVQVNHETTAVSRIVGDSPDALRQQLQKNDFTVQEAALFTHSAFSTKDNVKGILKSQFSDVTSNSLFDWKFTDVEKQLRNNKNNYFVLASNNVNTPYETKAGTITEIADWNLQKNNLFVFDSQYAGLYVPDDPAFASKLTQNSALVAPMSYTSGQFVKSFVCNIGKYPTVGEAYLQARNNYYVNTHQRSEFLGLTLLSYALYGSPLRTITVQNWDTSVQRKLCKGYDTDFTQQSADAYSISAVVPGVYRKEITADIGAPAIIEEGDFSLVTTEFTSQRFAIDELVTPFKTEVTEFPSKTVITNVELLGFDSPTDITVSNIPMWDGQSLQGRVCYYAITTNANIEFTQTYTEDGVLVAAHINPVDVENCEEGDLRIYTKARYAIDYLPYSPIRIKELNYPAELLPGQITSVEVIIENTQNSPADGAFVLHVEDEVISILPVTTTKSSYNLELVAPEEEGTYTFKVEFVQDDDTKTFTEFVAEVKALGASLFIPEFVDSRADVVLEIQNNFAEPLSVTIEDSISHQGDVIESNAQTLDLDPGTNKITITYAGLKQSDEQYDVLVNIVYEEANKVLTGTIITNHAPTIVQGNVLLKEGDVLSVAPLITDSDGDDVDVTIDAPFELDGSHTLTYEESGEYPLTITATDGLVTVKRTVTINVENTNRPPTINVDVLQAKEDEEFVVDAHAITDPDNENSVSNDDNELTITYDAPLDENGEFTPDYDSDREIPTTITVSDGEFVDTKQVTLKIENTNRPPAIDLPDAMQASYEIDLSEVVEVSDPDNENIATNDDQELTIIYPSPFDSSGKWTPPQPGMIFAHVKVTDGDYTVGKDIVITVDVVHPLPPGSTGITGDDADSTGDTSDTSDSSGTDSSSDDSSDDSTSESSDSTPPPPPPPPPPPQLPPPPPVSEPELVIVITADGREDDKTLTGKDTFKVRPDDEIELEISLENKASVTKKIEVEAEIDDLDQEEEDEITLDPGEREELEFEFFIPRLTDDDRYDLEILVKDGREKHSYDVVLKLDKKSHELDIRHAYFFPSALSCEEDETLLTVKLENTGRDNEEGVLRLESSTLGFEREIPFDLDEGESQVFRERFAYLEPGQHVLEATATYGSRSISKSAQLSVDACTAVQEILPQAPAKQEPEKITPATKTTVQKVKLATVSQSSEPDMLHNIIVAALLALIAIAVLITGYVIITRIIL